MRAAVATGFLGAAVGVTIALAGQAGAGPIDDAWPYGGMNGYSSPELPGFLKTGSATNEGQDAFGPISNLWRDYIFTHTRDEADDWYTVHYTRFTIPNLYTNEHTEVTGVLDDSAGYPSVGTVLDKTELFRITPPFFGSFELFTNTVLNDPELGYATQFTFLIPSISNTFLITEDGVKDVVSIGTSFTLFEIPFTADSGAGDASDVGDPFTLLLAALDGSA